MGDAEHDVCGARDDERRDHDGELLSDRDEVKKGPQLNC
jgi:hypothetical protein